MEDPKTGRNERLRARLHEIIFEADTKEGKYFDIALLVAIVLSVVVVLLESVQSYFERYTDLFWALEWFFTFIFTIEYFLRLYSVKSSFKYAKSFFGIIDLISILPTYISIFFGGTQVFMVIRIFRLIRVFRILKLTHLLIQGRLIIESLKASKEKIFVFLFVVILATFSFGAIMYFVEGVKNPGFDSIPRSIYWCIVTLTTVGYGDISPVTPLGQFLASLLMILGYSIIAVPTGIVTANMVNIFKRESDFNTQVCPNCAREGHDLDASFCKYCGEELNPK